MKLDNERTTIKQAAQGDGTALARISAHLQKIVTDYQKHSTREIAENHGRIEAQKFIICSIPYTNSEQREAFRMLMDEMIEQA